MSKSKKLYMLMKPAANNGPQAIKEHATKKEVGELTTTGGKFHVEIFGSEFTAKSKGKALGYVRGVFAAREMVNAAFPTD